MLVSANEDLKFYILFFIISFCISTFFLRKEFKQNGCVTNCLALILMSSIGSIVLNLALITFSSTYYIVEGDGKHQEYHILYSFVAPNGERIYTYGGKKYCYNKTQKEFEIRSLTYLPFTPLVGTTSNQIEKVVKPHEFFIVNDNIDELYFWEAPKSVTEKKNFHHHRCLFKAKNDME